MKYFVSIQSPDGKKNVQSQVVTKEYLIRLIKTVDFGNDILNITTVAVDTADQGDIQVETTFEVEEGKKKIIEWKIDDNGLPIPNGWIFPR